MGLVSAILEASQCKLPGGRAGSLWTVSASRKNQMLRSEDNVLRVLRAW